MKLSLVERETILLYNQAEPMAEVYTHDPRLMFRFCFGCPQKNWN